MADDLLIRKKRYAKVEDIPKVSSYVDPETVYTRLLSIVEADQAAADPLNTQEWLDPLDERYQKALDQTKSLGPHQYMGEPMTTVAHQYYGTTSAWHLIVAFNGFMHPDEIPSGSEIDIPSLEGFMEAFRAQTRKERRTIVF